MLGASLQPPTPTAAQEGNVVIEPYKEAKESCLDFFTRQYVYKLLKQCNGNISQAARLSHLTRAALQKIIRRYDIDGKQFR